MDCILKVSLCELVPSSFVSRCRETASSDSSVLEHLGELLPLWCFLPLFIKDELGGEGSREMVTLRQKNMLRDWMCDAATDGWCAEWACVTPEPKVTSVQHIGGDYDEDAVFLEQKKFLTETEKQATFLSTLAAQEADVSSGFTDMTVVLHGSAWGGISRMVSPDDVVKIRTCARCWNDGILYGDFGTTTKTYPCQLIHKNQCQNN